MMSWKEGEKTGILCGGVISGVGGQNRKLYIKLMSRWLGDQAACYASQIGVTFN